MLSSSTGHAICPDSSLSNAVIEEKMCDDNDLIESSHTRECSEPTPNYSSTYTSMAALQNIAVSKSAPHAIISSSSCLDNSNCERSSIQSHPYETYSGPCYNIDIKHKSETELTMETRQNSLRRGKWTREEEEYANAVVKEFNSGYLDAQPGTTLRIYLSEKLRCDPMRITKKFTGHDSIGKRVFHPTGRVGDGLTREARHAQANLEQLYNKWKERLEYQDKEYTRKSMAAQAVSQASLSNSILSTAMTPMGLPSGFSYSEATSRRGTENDIHTAALWLSRVIDIVDATPSKSRVGIENELQIISCLIEEAPVVLTAVSEAQRSKGIQFRRPCISETVSTKRKHSFDGTEASETNPMKLLASISSHAVPVPISQYQPSKKSKSLNRSVSTEDLADVHAFVQFLKSVN